MTQHFQLKKLKSFPYAGNRIYRKNITLLMIRKYSRQTEVEFVIFGIVTQHQENKIKEIAQVVEADSNIEDDKPTNIKEALMRLVEKLANMETTFTGRRENEIILDPIAVYREL